MSQVEWKIRVHAIVRSHTGEERLHQDYTLHSFEADILTGETTFDVRQEMAGRILATMIDNLRADIPTT